MWSTWWTLDSAPWSGSGPTATTIVDELVATVRARTPHPLDVRRGVHLQRLLTAAASDLA